MNYNVTLKRVRAIIVAVEKAINITYFECMCVDLGIRHAVRVRHIVICELLGSTIFSPT
jgi:hypothetical protein